MAFFSGLFRYRKIPYLSIQSNCYSYSLSSHFLHPSLKTQWFSTGTGSATQTEFPGENAYDILGVSETSSFAEIKASFRRLAKETHPDLAESKGNSSASSKRFVQILAAYEILSDSEKRGHYDSYLLSQRKIVQKNSRQGSTMYMYTSHTTMNKQMEVVEWLKWYRFAINDVVSQRKAVVGTGYFDVLEADFYSAIHRAYYGPVIESMDLLPDRFEAEERSVYETPEVLHLVSGRNLFGMVCLVDWVPQLSFTYNEKLTSMPAASVLSQSTQNARICMNDVKENHGGLSQIQVTDIKNHASDAYKDLELHVSGRVVAVATRIPPKSCFGETQNEDVQDHIQVFLTLDDDSMVVGNGLDDKVGSRILLGTITGLGTSPEEGSCFVYNSSGTKTHVITKHRTLLVKHMHWYRVGEEVSVCECRCSRARLPPSKFWLFEPRCGMHDIGGWYIETFGRDKQGRTVPSQRFWDGFDANEQFDERLHPAMYLLSLAYRTLDIEDAKRRKQTIREIVEGKLFRILNLCKKLV
ncbi:DnaJ domain - like 8 [Theobroma cacao]|nr:DnaJ domain - like 8 [Theobroma cacao]